MLTLAVIVGYVLGALTLLSLYAICRGSTPLPDNDPEPPPGPRPAPAPAPPTAPSWSAPRFGTEPPVCRAWRLEIEPERGSR